MKKFYTRIVSSLLSFFLITQAYLSFAQPSGVTVTYASYHASDGSGGNGNKTVTNPEYVAGTSGSAEPNDNSASLSATGQTLSTSSAWVQMEFPEISSSSSSPGTVFIRISSPSSFQLSNGLSVTAYNSSGTGVTIPAGYKTYYTTDGKIYIAVTPNANFKTVRLTITSALLGTTELRVYHAYYSSGSSNGYNPYPMSKTDCGRPNATSKEFSGALLTAFDVTTSINAIDEDINSKSSFVATGISLFSGFIRQTFIFNGDSNPSDAVRITLSQSGSFAKVMLGKSLTVKAYKGLNLVGNSALLNTILDVDLLNLFGSNGNLVTFYFAPKETNGTSVIFDRLELELDISLLGVALGSDGINVHDVRRVPDVVNTTDAIACTNLGIVNLVANAKQALIPDIGTFSYEWWNSLRDGTKLASTQTYNAQGLTTTGTATYYVQTQKNGAGCSSSERKKVTVNIINPPINPPIVFSP